ncbi:MULTISPECIES: GIY-YIG nuclease family protein [Deinococcus]|uniref:GIY-YIG nuclease family protein n=1 Tax=Deinococcus rufus TaxID=2136097 RepID=A0ABV7ZAC3_9DEIO|nr:GIY-YIG nuclease family protein [Deinococcus sp. AB2017081]WQE94414.1 GIY-YIG nuclease family protein [Deinococcus sp. AB2017081]
MTTYIYSLSDPRTQEIRYIGKTDHSKRRLSQHISDTKDGPYKTNWIASLKKDALSPIMTILEEVEEGWQERERFWIAALAPHSRLVNLTAGGEGGSYTPSAETLQKRSEGLKAAYQRNPQLREAKQRQMQGNQYSKGVPSSEKQKQWNRENKPAAKSWAVETPSGEILTVFSLRQFCLEHGLSQGSLSQTLSGKRKQHKNYKLIG